MNVIKIRVESFEAYGLNKYRNFIDPATQLTANYNDEEIIKLCQEMVRYSDCENCAIFIHFRNDQMCVVFEDEYYYNEGLDYFAQVDAELHLCCYALIMEIAPGQFKVIGD